MELTQEYFDKGISNLMDKIRVEMVSKTDLKVALQTQTVELKDYTHQAFEAQQTWMEHRFDELIVKYDVRERLSVLEKEVTQLKLGH